MVAGIDHGAGTPSVLAARTAISGGATLRPARPPGCSRSASSTAPRWSRRCSRSARWWTSPRATREPSPAPPIGWWPPADRRAAGCPGFGHRQHRHRDPRLDRLFAVAREAGTAGEHLAAAEAVEAALTRSVGRPVPINIDGAMAAVLGEVGFPSDLGNAVFIASRLAGILAHANEEQRTMPPMRRIDPVEPRVPRPRHRELSPVVGASRPRRPRPPDRREDHA